MKVFISHTFSEDDKTLSSILKNLLEQNGIECYEAENVKKYDKLIRDKIIAEIKNSDHMVAILTTDGVNSPSVNQELGYALREGISPIIMLENDSIQGVLTFGIDPEIFTKETFSDSCKNVLQHIKDSSPRKKIPENMIEISEKMDKILSNTNSSTTQPINFSGNTPEDLWYSEIMRYVETNPFENTAKMKKQTKQLYSEIKMIKDEVDRMTISYNNADNNTLKRKYAEKLRPGNSKLKEYRNNLRNIWSDL